MFSFVNALLFSYDVWETAGTIDDILVWVFTVELMIRIIAIGPEDFFADRWNTLDSFLIILGFIFLWIPVSDNAGSLAKIGRIFRIASLMRVISRSNFT